MSGGDSNLTVNELKKFTNAGLNGRSLIILLLLWFFLGYFGAHRFYWGKTKSAVLMALATIVGIITTFLFIGVFVLIGVGIWWVIDLVIILMAASKEADQKMQTGVS